MHMINWETGVIKYQLKQDKCYNLVIIEARARHRNLSADALSLANNLSLPAEKVKAAAGLLLTIHPTLAIFLTLIVICEGRKDAEMAHSTTISMQAAKALIESVSPQIIDSVKTQISNLIMVAVWLHSGSKVSNIIYYLCRTCPSFIKLIVPHLQNIRERLIKQRAKETKISNKPLNSNRQCEMMRKWGIILTDMFVFGIHFTQHQFVTDILPNILSVENCDNKIIDTDLEQKYLIDKCMFHMAYICRYLQVLTLSSTMIEHCRHKLVTQLCQLMNSLHIPVLNKLRQHMKDCCSDLQQAYSQISKYQKCINKQQGRTIIKQPQQIVTDKKIVNKTQQTVQVQTVAQIQTAIYFCPQNCVCYLQQNYLTSIHEYEHFRSRLQHTIELAAACLSVCGRTCKYESVQHIRNTIAGQYEAVLPEQQHNSDHYHNQKESNCNDTEIKTADKSQQQSGEGYLQQFNNSESKSKENCDIIQQQNNKRTKQQRILLLKLYNSCKYYGNKQKIGFDPLYSHTSVTESQTKSSQICCKAQSSYQYKYLDELPPSFTQRLKNCCTVQQSDQLSCIFVRQYNKYTNRAILANTIFDELHDRNNLPFIIRVLTNIAQVQQQEVHQLVQHKLHHIISNSNGKIGKGLYGRYAHLATQLVKFRLYSEQQYLTNLLKLVAEMSGIPVQQQSTLTHSSSTINGDTSNHNNTHNNNNHTHSNNSNNGNTNNGNSNSNVQQLYLSTLISILQKLGQQVYYSSLQSHILMNQIIERATQHMRKKTISYQLQTINRFNCIISYLRNTSSTKYRNNSDNQNRILLDKLKDDTLFWQHINAVQQSIQNNEQEVVDKLIHSIANSIQYENYMETYYFAQMIYQINSKLLQKSVIKMTNSRIKEYLSSGNFQGAANWGRFLGQLHRYQVLTQADMLNYLSTQVMYNMFSSQPCACIKVICACIQTCGSCLKNSSKTSDMNRVLCWLLQLKVQLLKVNGLQTNLILEQEVQDMFQYFHIGFKYMRCVADCQYVYTSIQNGKTNQNQKSKQKPKTKKHDKQKYQCKDQQAADLDVESIIDDYYNQCIRKEQQLLSKAVSLEKQSTIQQNNKIVNGYLAKQDKSTPKDTQIKYKQKEKEQPKIDNEDFVQLTLLQNSQLSSLCKQSLIKINEKQAKKKQKDSKKQNVVVVQVQYENQQNKVRIQMKKMKVIGRPRNNKVS